MDVPNRPWTERVKKAIFRLARKLPQVQAQIQSETEKVRTSFEKEMLEPTNNLVDLLELPDGKMSAEQVLELTETYLGCGEFDWKQGTFSGTVYNGNDELTGLITKVYGMAAWTNPLHPDAFPGVRKMEAEIVRMCCDMFNVSELIFFSGYFSNPYFFVWILKIKKQIFREENPQKYPNFFESFWKDGYSQLPTHFV